MPPMPPLPVPVPVPVPVPAVPANTTTTDTPSRNVINWSKYYTSFHPVVPSFPLRGEVAVLDLSGKHEASIEEQMTTPPYSIGKYDENRNIYKTALFEDGRSLHVGLGE